MSRSFNLNTRLPSVWLSLGSIPQSTILRPLHQIRELNVKLPKIVSRFALLPFLLSSAAADQALSHKAHPSTRKSAPEIDVALAGAAAAVLIGGVLIVTQVRRKRLANSANP